MMNVVVISGRLTKDPKFAPGANGDTNKDRASFHVAVTDVYSKPDAAGKQRADFIPCTAWGVNAKNIAQYCKQGKEVTIKGHLRTNTVENADGTKSYFWECVVEAVQFGADAKNQKGKTEQVTAPAGGKNPLEEMTPEQLLQMQALITDAQTRAAKSTAPADPFPKGLPTTVGADQ